MTDGKTVAQIREQQESLWQFMTQLPASFEAQILYALLIFGIVGMIGNYTLRWARDEIQGNLFCYLFVQYPRRTILAYSAYLGLALTALASGMFMHEGQFAGWLNVIVFAMTTGFTVDVTANKGVTKVLTPQERAEKRAEIETAKEGAKP